MTNRSTTTTPDRCAHTTPFSFHQVKNIDMKKFGMKSEVKVALFRKEWKRVGFDGEKVLRERDERMRIALRKMQGPPVRPSYSVRRAKGRIQRL